MKKSLNKKSGTLQQTFKHILKHGSQLELQKYSKNSNFDDLFQPIQPFLQQSDENILNFIHYCMIEIKKNNQKNKLVIIYLIHSIFRISSKFRKEFCEHLSDFVTGIGLNSHDSLPISEAKNILLRVIAEWDYEFGKLYPSLRATARYLKETLRLPLPDIRVCNK